MRKAFWLIVAIVLVTGCDARAQTPADHRAALKSFLDSQPDSAVPTLENAWKPYGYVPPTTPPPPVSDRKLIWSTTNETHAWTAWNFGRQAVFDSGNGKTEFASPLFAKSGAWVLKQSATFDGTSGARCFIQADAQNKVLPDELYATTYVYIPSNTNWRNYNWFNLQQLKERLTQGATPFVDPTIEIVIQHDSTGPYLTVYNWIPGQKVYYPQVGARTYLPLGKWVKLEWYTNSRVSGGATWLKQDDKLIVDQKNIKTVSNDNYVVCWSVNCYGGAGPGTVTLYWDDCMLETNK